MNSKQLNTFKFNTIFNAILNFLKKFVLLGQNIKKNNLFKCFLLYIHI